MTNQERQTGSSNNGSGEQEPDPEKLGLTGTFLFCVLQLMSYPLRCLHSFIRRKIQDSMKLYFDESWYFLCAIILIICIWVASGHPQSIFIKIVIALFPCIRVFDILHLLFNLSFVQMQVPRSVPRSVILLFLHYLEMVLAFACFYLLLQTVCNMPIFTSGGRDIFLSGVQAVYFSIITAATVGYGDFAPIREGCGIVVMARVIISFQVIAFVFITVVEIPRLLGFYRNETSDKSKNGVG